MPVLICLYSRNFSTTGIKSLCVLACFWYFAGSARISGSLINRVISSYFASRCSSLSNISNRHRLWHSSILQDQRLVESANCDFQLRVVGLLCRHALQPKSWKGDPLQHTN